MVLAAWAGRGAGGYLSWWMYFVAALFCFVLNNYMNAGGGRGD